MGKNTSVSLGEHFEEFVQERIEERRYIYASEIIREGLRLLEQEEQKFYTLRNAIQKGIDSGIAVNINPDNYLKQLKKTRQNNG